MRRNAALFLLALAASLPAAADRVTVFAAASLKDALDAAARGFEAASGHRVVVSYAASSALARQIEAGAPAELFLSADIDWVDYVHSKGLVAPGSRRDLLGNELVLVAPTGSHMQVKLAPGVNLATLLGDRRLALANPEVVPAGKYAKAALTSLGAWSAVQGKVAAAENVRATLALVARGEAPLGIVYRTDAMAEKAVRIVDTFPAGSHPAIVYPLVRLKGAGAAAAALEQYLANAQARSTFARFGFRAP